MADGVIFIGWTNSVRGREQASQTVFEEAMGFLGRLRAAGEIEGLGAVGGFTGEGVARRLAAFLEASGDLV